MPLEQLIFFATNTRIIAQNTKTKKYASEAANFAATNEQINFKTY